METKTVKNKWNGKLYTVLAMNDCEVTLEREDGSQFTIQKKEYFFSYKVKK